MNTTDNFVFFKKLLKDFESQLPLKRPPKTFMEITRFPHSELACSNMLAFFLDPNEEHGLGDVLLSSLLEAYNQKYTANFTIEDSRSVKVKREDRTDSNKSIDLEIITDWMIIGIENKIYAGTEYNPYSAYTERLEKIATEKGIAKDKIIKILLGLRADESRDGFLPLSYEDIFFFLKQKVGLKTTKENQRGWLLLTEFINTIENLKKGTPMNDKAFHFLENNSKAGFEFYLIAQELLNNLQAKTKEIRGLLKKLPEEIKISIYDEMEDGGEFHSTLFCDLVVSENLTIALDAKISLDGWRIYAFSRNERQRAVNAWLESNKITPLRSSEREWIYGKFEFNENVEVVRDKYKDLILKIYNAANTA
jgi:hypothetical protein